MKLKKGKENIMKTSEDDDESALTIVTKCKVTNEDTICEIERGV